MLRARKSRREHGCESIARVRVLALHREGLARCRQRVLGSALRSRRHRLPVRPETRRASPSRTVGTRAFFSFRVTAFDYTAQVYLQGLLGYKVGMGVQKADRYRVAEICRSRDPDSRIGATGVR